MYLLNEKLRNFFPTLMIIILISSTVAMFWNKDLYDITFFMFSVIYTVSFYIMFFVYIIYPLIKIQLKKYGSLVQKILVLLLLICLIIAFWFYQESYLVCLAYILYLAVFLNFSSFIGEKYGDFYILSSSIKEDPSFSEIISSSSFNVLMSVVLLTVVFAWGLNSLYIVLVTILSIALVISSVIYGKSDKSFN